MSDHQRPTAEELEAGIKKATEDLDKLNSEEKKDPVSEPEETEEVVSDEEEIVEDEDDTEEGEKEEVEETEEVEEKKESPPDVETRYVESTKEAQKLAEDKKKIDTALHDAHNISEPTDEELKAEYGNWEELDDTTRKIARDSLWNKKRFQAIDQADEERRTIQEWDNKVIDYIDDPKTFIHHPELEGKREDFIKYATDKSRRNVNLSLLVSAFKTDYKVTMKKHKGQMMETGTGGDSGKPKQKDGKLSLAEGQRLMSTNYKKYIELLKDGKIASI